MDGENSSNPIEKPLGGMRMPFCVPDGIARYRRVLWIALLVNAAMFLVEITGGPARRLAGLASGAR
jgi:Co/Zn/Cd efflux system component